MTRAIDNSARTIRLPIHISEKLSKMRRVSRELSHKFGRQPTRLEMATEMGIDQKDLEDLISQSAPCASLDAHARGEEDRSFCLLPLLHVHLGRRKEHFEKLNLLNLFDQFPSQLPFPIL